MKYNTQNDPEWANEIMTEGIDNKGKQWTDYLKDYGCLVTSLANIIQEYRDITFTPFELNDMLVKCNGYYWLRGKSDSGMPVYESTASMLSWITFCKLFACEKKIVTDVIEHNLIYYIAKVINFGSDHYINLLKKVDYNNYLCFDVYDGKEKLYKKSDIKTIIEIKFKA